MLGYVSELVYYTTAWEHWDLHGHAASETSNARKAGMSRTNPWVAHYKVYLSYSKTEQEPPSRKWQVIYNVDQSFKDQ